MPAQPTLKITEIFAGIQGEGLRLGRPALFVRLAGCNLRCSFCDTKNAWSGGRTMTIEAVAAALKRNRKSWSVDWVCLTGGEPFTQDIGPLVDHFHRDGFRVQVETNGTIFKDHTFDWVTVSPKPPRYEVAAEFLGQARDVKLVVSRELTLPAVRRVRADFPASIPIFFQPESNRADSRGRAVRLLQRALSEGLEEIRLGVQLHRVFGLR
ncbi:MAG: 7-carboxy-7-deazaguanine synthase QueE [Candidatus Aminicenantes bacterium]|nr:7-carboxy-7-deazaguanine synthase QueE [Candidatus Aminicenantes bacterium]